MHLSFPKQRGKVCVHLLQTGIDETDIVYHLTGIGTQYNVICLDCAKDIAHNASNLQSVTDAVFDAHDDGYTENIIGKPEILTRSSDLQFSHRMVQLEMSLPATVIDIKPCHWEKTSQWVALLASGEIIRLDLDHRKLETLYAIPKTDFTLGQHPRLELADGTQFAAVVNDKASDGIIIDLQAKHITMQLNRGSYHAEQTQFPLGFFQHNAETYVVYATDWNRLDISNAYSGALLTKRDTTWNKGDERPPHYLDYFHAGLTISPNSTWIAEDGWVWSPFGLTRTWNLQTWLANIWESDDGDSIKYLNQRWYLWDVPLCWITDEILAVWGFGNDDEYVVDGVGFFNAVTGKSLGWFAGPKQGLLVFDEHLFSASDDGVDVWDVQTGERLVQDSTFNPLAYHHGTQQFLTQLSASDFQLSTLERRNKGNT